MKGFKKNTESCRFACNTYAMTLTDDQSINHYTNTIIRSFGC